MRLFGLVCCWYVVAPILPPPAGFLYAHAREVGVRRGPQPATQPATWDRVKGPVPAPARALVPDRAPEWDRA